MPQQFVEGGGDPLENGSGVDRKKRLLSFDIIYFRSEASVLS